MVKRMWPLVCVAVWWSVLCCVQDLRGQDSGGYAPLMRRDPERGRVSFTPIFLHGMFLSCCFWWTGYVATLLFCHGSLCFFNNSLRFMQEPWNNLEEPWNYDSERILTKPIRTTHSPIKKHYKNLSINLKEPEKTPKRTVTPNYTN